MGKLAVNMFTTLDGVLQAPGAPNEDTDLGFEHGGWQVPYFDDESGQVIVEAMSRFDALLLGRKTYQIFAAFWPHASEDDPIAARLNTAPKYVVSRSLTKVDWQNSTLISGNVSRAVTDLKDEYDEIHVIGSGYLVQNLMVERLVDEYNVWTYPLLLGSGKRLFGHGTVPTALELVETRTFPTGAILTSYRPVGRPTYGTA